MHNFFHHHVVPPKSIKEGLKSEKSDGCRRFLEMTNDVNCKNFAKKSILKSKKEKITITKTESSWKNAHFRLGLLDNQSTTQITVRPVKDPEKKQAITFFFGLATEKADLEEYEVSFEHNKRIMNGLYIF